MTFVADSDAWGGAEVHLTHHLRRAAGLGWTASLVAAEPVAARLAPVVPPAGGLAVVPVARHAAGAPAVRAALAASRPDVVAVNLVDPASNAAVVEAALAVAPAVGTLHLGGDTGRPGLAALYTRLAAVLTPSSDIAARVSADLGLPAGQVRVVPNGVDVPSDPAGPAGHRVPRVGALGRLTAQKGFDVLLEAVGRLVAAGTPLALVVGGEGRDGAALRAAAAGLPVTFTGFVEDVRGFLAALDVFVVSSRVEAGPLVLLEAMAEGLPCVSTDVGDVAVRLGGDVVVVPTEDAGALAAALGGLLADPARRADLARRARARAVADLDADLMVRRTFAVLARAAGVPAGGAGKGPGRDSRRAGHRGPAT
ncbi:glycosyltransferase family 4 protein [Geodermatophilus sp. DSM 44513]|uniref:glycosyltransferase family 4 protein n=1 Tax=Geodermatophilus sp. DSM 44513 TaxID=1528104 RepID=UPI0028F6E164|nr:glycosyltransferase family 4 protein [Geodermatophilus sp. DSM 44513]WNV73723.1 glycosyltransferase family 4 protein [Geodermatophilus sp. DSM 44513]